ncbi:DNA polymerase III subunit gamma/tau [Oceanobacter mangrovi]|uniref:DNA polymerase III subunit gamma/tau n=1 Tax=Oceanobacter mangrovi TaxID=2862510 RepID=UPI001C8EB937|nr:DNA polymerase III subunit gamma/tau [Oceanobacter mangrovi]
MSYQVLARKWRPKFFHEMVGQEHVLRALINALDEQRLHHAYLFTGTRGVGKTTIARILAKCLNCEQGISSRPCGECSSCREIAEGRFVDLIEVDAASRTKVEDTRELLDNVQYAPTRGRFKVYLIDEVHMLSTHSFNALLKTLEEPPEHVKFLLATTDPQKLPVTILSRCLQFSLKNMTPESIVGYLESVLQAEDVGYELPALWQLGRAAQGSMRDALSLTDQAIAFGEGTVLEQQVTSMLGTMDRGRLFRLAEVLARANPPEVLQEVAEMAELGPDFDEVVQGLLSVWHKAALAQVVPDAIDNAEGDRQAILALALAMNGEDLQLYYQIALSGRKDIAQAPDPRQGFEMLLLRMLAFRPMPEQLPTALAELDLATALTTPPSQLNAPSAAAGTDDEQKKKFLTDSPASEAVVETDTAAQPLVSPEPLAEPGAPVAEAPETVEQKIAEPVALEPAPAEPTPVEHVTQSATESSPTAADYGDAGYESADYGHSDDHDQSAGHSGYADESETPPWDPDPREPASAAAITAVPAPAVSAPPAPKPAPAAKPMAAPPNEPVARPGGLSQLMEQPMAAPTFTPEPRAAVAAPVAAEPEVVVPVDQLPELAPHTWWMWLAHLPLAGLPMNIARNSALVAINGSHYQFDVDPQQGALFNANQQQRIEIALQTLIPAARVEMQLQTPRGETPDQRRQRLHAESVYIAQQSIETDGRVKNILSTFNAMVVEDSIRPLQQLS